MTGNNRKTKTVIQTLVVMALIVITMVSAAVMIYGRNSRQAEGAQVQNTEEVQPEHIADVFPQIVEESISKTLTDNAHKEYSREEFVSLFIQNLNTLSQDAGGTDDMQIELMGADEEKGMLSVRVTFEYMDNNGEMQTISCERTGVFEPSTEQNVQAEPGTDI